MAQRLIWDNLAEVWNKFRKKSPEEITEFLLEKKGKILDLGCGSGRNLVSGQKEYYCVDFSQKMLDFAKENSEKQKINANFVLADIGKEKLPFKDNFFDSAVFISTLHCLETQEKRKKSLGELFRVLKKGSEALISVWNKEKNERFKNVPGKEFIINFRNNGESNERYYYFYDKSELKQELENTGFSIISKNIKPGNHSKNNIIFYVKK